MRPDMWDRVFRAAEKAEERLCRAAGALQGAGIIAALIGAKAVEHWVRTADEASIRNTPNVDFLLDRADLPAAQTALERVGFVRFGNGDRPVVMLDGANGSDRQAIRIWLSGDTLKPGVEPLPEVGCSLPTQPHRVVPLAVLVRMKLSAFRRIDRVHLRDLIGVGLIDGTWPDRFPAELADRLREILADPDG